MMSLETIKEWRAECKADGDWLRYLAKANEQRAIDILLTEVDRLKEELASSQQQHNDDVEKSRQYATREIAQLERMLAAAIRGSRCVEELRPDYVCPGAEDGPEPCFKCIRADLERREGEVDDGCS